jgi:cation diffusion facilitator CzcD-associated flavoprotein CzcO
VAVIGAGSSGVVAVKELLEEGHDPTCFEAAEGIGGVLNPRPVRSAAHRRILP